LGAGKKLPNERTVQFQVLEELQNQRIAGSKLFGKQNKFKEVPVPGI
jgi:hypothetical protein